MKNNIVVVFSSHLSEEENQKFINHIDNTIGVKHKTICYPNHNQFSLAEVYNDAIENHYEKNCVFVMCHNDITIKTKNWGKVLLSKFKNSGFDIIGVAGSTYLPESGRWWDDRTKMLGIVEHTNGIADWASEYSSEIFNVRDAVLIDGLFMAFNPDTIHYKFNEAYKGFHFYDLSFCIPNYLFGCDIGVTTSIRIKHDSVGETNEGWEENRLQFVNEYKDELPIKHINDKIRVLITCQFFKNLTGSELYVYELSKGLVKNGCEVTIISSMVGEPLLSKAKSNGVKVYSLNNLPNHKLVGEEFKFFKNETDFDIIHINHKPIGDMILQLYPNTPAIMQVHSEVIPVFEVPIIHPQIKKYLSIRDSVTEYIKTFGVSDEDIIMTDNPFDTKRFNTNYTPIKNEKEVVLFVGTLDYLRKNMIIDLINYTRDNNQELWLIGADNSGHDFVDLTAGEHVTYLGVKSNVEEYVKKCDYTAGIFKGRSTIEGYLCGKKGWIYNVDDKGNIISKELTDVPNDLSRYSLDFVSGNINNIYHNVLGV